MNDLTEIRVGVLHSLTGTMANNERHLVNAAVMAIDELNQSGGVLGRQIKAVVKDGASDPAVFAMQAEKLLKEEKVTAIFGCWTSASRKAVKPIVEELNSILWYPVQYEGLEQSPNIIYTGSCLNQQIEPAINWALSSGKQKSFLLGSDYVFPRTANSLIRMLITMGGGQILGEQYVPLGSDSFEEAVKAIRILRPDIVYNTINGDGNLSFFRRFAEEKIDVNECMIMSFSFSEIELQDVVEEAAGHYACWSYFQTLQTLENKKFLDKYKQEFGGQQTVSDPIVTAYTQVYLWKHIVDSAGSYDSKEILCCIAGKHVVGPSGLFKLHENNHIMKPAFIGKATQSGQFDIVWSSDSLIDPKPWLGIEDTELKNISLIKDALGRYPEVIHLNWMLSQEVRARKQTEAALLSEKRISEEYINSLPGLFYIFDKQRLIKWNSEFNRVTGYSDEELASNYGTDFFEGEDRTLIGERMLKVFRDGVSEAEAELVTKDGRRIPYYFTGLRKKFNGKDHLIGLGIDITERKRMEEALRESEKKFRSLFENMQNGFALHEMMFDEVGTPIDYIFLDVNEAFEKQTGLKKENIIGKKATEVLTGIENDPFNWIGTYGKVVHTGNSIAFESYSESIKKWYSVVAYRPNEGQFAVVFIDITERKQAEEERLQREKIQAVLETAGAACHELNQPLQAISGYSTLLSMELSEKNPLYGKVRKIKEEIDRMGEITAKLMGITRYETKVYSGEKKIIDLDNVIERRKYKRFIPSIRTIVMPQTDSPKQHQIIDISMGGLAFWCNEIQDQLDEFDELSINMTDGNFYLDNLPCKTISDLTIADDSPSRSVSVKRRGVQFGDLNPNQTDQLEYFIENHTIAG